MLTRIEIDGFKSFADFAVDLDPFTVILGQNASGKSNLFDAMQFLRRAMTDSVLDAMAGGRARFGEVFRVRGDGRPVDRMRFAVEVLLAPQIVDHYRKRVTLDRTRLRYELTIERRADPDGLFAVVAPEELPFVVSEAVLPLTATSDRWAAERSIAPEFRTANLRYGDADPLLWTRTEGGEAEFLLRGQGGVVGGLSATAAAATALSSITTAAEYPLLYALRQEIAGWRSLHFDPAKLRLPSDVPPRSAQLQSDGTDLPAVVRRIAEDKADDGLLRDLVADLALMVRGFRDIRLQEISSTGEWEIRLDAGGEGEISARAASDGTLRILASLAAVYDPGGSNVICFEEPENGIHPQRLRDFIGLLRDRTIDVSDYQLGDRLVQAVLTSHSPLLLLADLPQTLIFDWVSRQEEVRPGVWATSRVTRARRVIRVGETPAGPGGHDLVSRFERSQMTGILPDEATAMLG